MRGENKTQTQRNEIEEKIDEKLDRLLDHLKYKGRKREVFKILFSLKSGSAVAIAHKLGKTTPTVDIYRYLKEIAKELPGIIETAPNSYFIKEDELLKALTTSIIQEIENKEEELRKTKKDIEKEGQELLELNKKYFEEQTGITFSIPDFSKRITSAAELEERIGELVGVSENRFIFFGRSGKRIKMENIGYLRRLKSEGKECRIIIDHRDYAKLNAEDKRKILNIKLFLDLKFLNDYSLIGEDYLIRFIVADSVSLLFGWRVGKEKGLRFALEIPDEEFAKLLTLAFSS